MRYALLSCAVVFGLSLTLSAVNASPAIASACPAEIKTGTNFPLKDAAGVTWHNSNSVNFNIDYATICTWTKPVASKLKQGKVCTYSEFSDCSVGGTPAGTKFYVTDYKPVVKAAATKHR